MRTRSARGPALRISLLLALLVGGTACGDNQGSTTPTTDEASPSEEPAPSEEVPAAPLSMGTLDPGRYTFEFSDFDVSFTLGDGWQHQNQVPNAGFELVYGEPVFPPDLTAITMFVTPPSASEIPELIRGLDGVTVESSSIGGPSGTEMLISVGGKTSDPLQILEIGDPPVERYFLVRGDNARIIIQDYEGQALVMVIEGPEAGFEDFNATAQGVVDSLEIT